MHAAIAESICLFFPRVCLSRLLAGMLWGLAWGIGFVGIVFGGLG